MIGVILLPDRISVKREFYFDDARVKSLKPRCACTGVVSRLSDPPDMSIKVERKLHDMRILGRVLCASGTRFAPIGVNTETQSMEQSV